MPIAIEPLSPKGERGSRKHKQPDVFSGGKQFSFELFKNVSLFLSKKQMKA
jgi:hypothetical protein